MLSHRFEINMIRSIFVKINFLSPKKKNDVNLHLTFFKSQFLRCYRIIFLETSNFRNITNSYDSAVESPEKKNPLMVNLPSLKP